MHKPSYLFPISSIPKAF